MPSRFRIIFRSDPGVYQPRDCCPAVCHLGICHQGIDDPGIYDLGSMIWVSMTWISMTWLYMAWVSFTVQNLQNCIGEISSTNPRMWLFVTQLLPGTSDQATIAGISIRREQSDSACFSPDSLHYSTVHTIVIKMPCPAWRVFLQT